MKPSSNAVLFLDKTKSELATYLHTAAGWPTKYTLISDINNRNFTIWLGLATQLISKYLPPSIQTMKLNLKQEPQNPCSTKYPLSPYINIKPEVPLLK